MELAVTVLVDGLRGKEPFSHGRENTRRVPAMIPRLNNNDNHNNGKKTVSLYRVRAIFNKTPTTYFVAIDRPEMVYKLLVGGEGGIGEQKKLSIFIFFIIIFFFRAGTVSCVLHLPFSVCRKSPNTHTESDLSGHLCTLGEDDVFKHIHPWYGLCRLVGRLPVGRLCVCRGSGLRAIQEIPIPSSPFCCEPHTAPGKK